MGFFTNLYDTAKKAVETGVSDVGNYFTNIANQTGETLKKQIPTVQQSDTSKKIITAVTPGVQDFIEGGAKQYTNNYKFPTPVDIGLGFVGGADMEIGKGLVNSLVKSTNIGEITNLLSKAGAPADLIPSYAKKFAKASTEAEVTAGLDSLKNTTSNTSKAPLFKGTKPVNPGHIESPTMEADTPSISKPGTELPITNSVNSEESSLFNSNTNKDKSPVKFNITGTTDAEKVQSAIVNSERIKNELSINGKDAYTQGQKLSPADLKLAEGYEHGIPISDLAKNAEKPKQFTAFMDKLKKYYDFRLEADTAAGGNTGYVENYLPHNWDLSKPEDLTKFNNFAIQRGVKPYNGFRSQPRVFNSYMEGEKEGFKRGNSNILQDLQRDYQGASNGISRTVLKNGLMDAVPNKVNTTGRGLTQEGKPFINSNIGGLEGISYHPEVANMLKGYEPLTNTDIFLLAKDNGFDISKPSTYNKLWDALQEGGVINTVSSLYDKANTSLKHFILNFSGFHSINVSANHAGASIFGKPLTGAKGFFQSIPSFFSEEVTQKIINGFKNKIVKGQDFSVFDAGLRSGVNMDRGLPAKGASLFNPMSALSRAMFDRELYTLKLNLVDQVFSDGKVLPESPQGRALAKEINQFMGEMNNHTMNMNPNTQKWFSRLLLAPHFTESKYALMGKALSTNPTKSLALKGVIGKSLVMGTLATMGTLLATGKFPNLNQVLLNYTISPNIQTNLTNPKGQKQDIGLPQTFVSEPGAPIGGLFQGSTDALTHYAEARLSPALSDAIASYTNKDYYGNPIIDPNSKESSLSQIMKNLGATDLPIGVQALVNMKEGKITPQQAAITIIGLKTHINPNDPTSVYYKQIDDAKSAISKISGSDPQRVEKMQAIMNSISPEQRKSAAYKLMLSGIDTKGVYTSETERKYFQIQDLIKQGKIDEATDITKAMTPKEYTTYKTIKTRLAHEALYNQISGLVAQGKIGEATALTSKMTKTEYKAYQNWKANQ